MPKNFSKFLPFIIFFSSFFCAEVSRSEINTPLYKKWDFVKSDEKKEKNSKEGIIWTEFDGDESTKVPNSKKEKVKANNPLYKKDQEIPTSYLNSRNELEDYIIDTGDGLYIEFENNSKGNPDLIKKEKFRDGLTTEYLKTNTDLENYFLDEDDQILIKFIKTPELNTSITVDRQGEVYLPRIKETYVRGLSIYELSKLLEDRYQEFLLDPEIEIEIKRFRFIKSGTYNVDIEGEIFLPKIEETFVRGLTPGELSNLLELKYSELGISAEITIKIATFKKLRILVNGEIRSPGVFEFPAYSIGDFKNVKDQMGNDLNEELSLGKNLRESDNMIDLNTMNEELNSINNVRFDDLSLNNDANASFEIKRPSERITTISNAIRAAGGVTSRTDLSRIELIRDIPIGKGGGKKSAYIDFSSFLNESDPTNDIRLFDGDRLIFSKLSKADPSQIPESILSGISPRFISVNLFGRVESPGVLKLPLEASLSDAIDLSGPIKPLSGKVVIIRYQEDGTILKKNIAYSAGAKRGSKRNPYLKEDDLISVKNSIIGKASGIIGEITAPFFGIYTTKEIIEELSE